MLERELQTKLKESFALRTHDPAQDRTPMVEGTIGRATVECPDRAVKGIQRLEPELEFLCFCEKETLVQAQVDVGVRGTTNVADTAGPERAVGWITDVRGVEPLDVSWLTTLRRNLL